MVGSRLSENKRSIQQGHACMPARGSFGLTFSEENQSSRFLPRRWGCRGMGFRMWGAYWLKGRGQPGPARSEELNNLLNSLASAFPTCERGRPVVPAPQGS